MKRSTCKTVYRALAFLTAIGFNAGASADSQDGSLGSIAGAVDRYKVTCSANAAGATGRLEIRIKKTSSGSPLVSIQAYQQPKGNSLGAASNTTDPVGGDQAESPSAYVYGSDGAFYVTVDKAGIGVADYTFFYQCQTVNGSGGTGTSISSPLQNQ